MWRGRTTAILRAGDLDEWWSAHSVLGQRVALRPLRGADHAALVRSIDDEVLLWQGWRSAARTFPLQKAQMLERGEEALRQLHRVPIACPRSFVVLDDGGQLIGSVSMTESELPELGWWLGPTGRGRGLSVEMLQLALDYTHRHLGHSRATMATSADNVRARTQMERSGCTLISATVRKLPNRRKVDAVVYEHLET